MWRRGTAQQRLRLGPVGYFCGCDRRLTHSNSNCNSNRDCHRHCYGHGDTYTNGDADCNYSADGNTNWDSQHYTQAGSYGTTASHTYAQAIRRDFQAIS